MLMAYDPDKFHAAAPFTFLVASVIILFFGPGKIALDGILCWLVFFLSSRRLLQCQ